ncbi:sugar phosphate isomerase/epimerase family protein [Aureimonas pseudogalii]|uniref:Sugar phosphate isomerase/epimerase n=1 Tax=Aureimonas pseudogalii TaxID=1744844 RepID=A0A7W6MLW2_9HYPH|nr:sugar phosphate isomerase/epimerase [Aureimonas pseudogalii]MBB4000180.1 sugar phosphate isomerase/epimerase [Aureimonas pseudogalii]
MHRAHRLSLAYLTVQGCPPEEQIRVAAAAGYDATSLRLVAPNGVDLAHPILGDAALIRRIKAATANEGISLFDAELLTLLPDTDVRHWAPAIETAAELGMPMMQITSDDADLARAADRLAGIADVAAGYAVTLAIELTRWRAMSTLADAKRLVEAAGRSNVGILIDALHLSRSGGRPDDVRTLDRDRVLYLQLCDAPAEPPASDAACIAEARGGRLMPGEGGLWLDELMSVLGPDITISVETPHAGDAALSFGARAEKAMAATRRFLDAPRSGGGGAASGRC